MDIGQLRHQITVLRLGSTQDAIGQPIETWTTFARPWARVRHDSATEGEKAGALKSVVRCEIRTRYRTDITAADRITHKGKTYRITGVRPNEMNLEWTDFDCELIE